ncbi:DEAD/DEAH box helicase domain protein [Desulforamulus reducens MI-1]|uniref:DEAD/DEAH box helicase domain protein n=1 Tax=Desulforamulus reducens (strain ATCC BAA-1160 / DSM 100696 / MI-1) TaxID=349161 RepID=A4J5M3_DESRM|nr:DEAD/DEAH box helicase [Desulforamulus reducens]ABO50376.1 DEAD/DEAH box helicase domain protein [Desulforamulus reducens MI-1]
MVTSFDKLEIDADIAEGLSKQGIKNPTAIQKVAIPLALKNKDIIGQSQTGSGKTLAYLLPIFQKIDSSKRETQALILAPTHELVMQIDKQIKTLSSNAGLTINSTVMIGEVNIVRQIEKLKEKPHIIVGSTGRVLELIKRKKISSHTIKTIVIDEADMLLDQNNLAGVKDVIKTTMRDRQLMIFSAYMNQRAMAESKELTKDAEVIIIEDEILVNPNITHLYLIAEQRDKMKVLRKLIAATKPKKAIIFVNKMEDIQTTALKLQYHNFKVSEIYGKAAKEERQKAMEGFRSEGQLLVASDMAARGLDINGVTHIFNLDLPEDSKEYLHRVGRTGRKGKLGTAISIVTERETALLKKYEREFKIIIEEKNVFKGVLVDPVRGKSSFTKKRDKALSKSTTKGSISKKENYSANYSNKSSKSKSKKVPNRSAVSSKTRRGS